MPEHGTQAPPAKVLSYWDLLPQKSPNWIDYLGLALILMGIAYIVLAITFPTLFQDPKVPISINDLAIALPSSLTLIVAGLLSIARLTQRKIAIPVLRTLLEAYIHIGITCTAIGMRAHFKVKKMSLLLSVLVIAFAVTQAKANSYREQLAADDETRRLLINYIDRHYLNLAARPFAMDLINSIHKNKKKLRESLLSESVKIIENIYSLEDPKSEFTRAQFKANLQELSTTIEEQRIITTERDNERNAVDALLYLTLAATLENVLSQDGTNKPHARRALTVAEEGLNHEEKARAQIEAGGLPVLHSFRNTLGVAWGMHALGEAERFDTLSERLALFEKAYDSITLSSSGPSFCQQRAINNKIDLELKILRLPNSVLSALASRESALGKSIATATREPQIWIKNRTVLLDQIDQYLNLPEISMTRLQVISAFANRKSSQSNSRFCSSQDFIEWRASAEGALRRGLALGFDDCGFFEDLETSHISILRLCLPPEGTSQLCSLLSEHFRDRDNCTPCRIM